MPPKKCAEKKKEQNVRRDNHWSEGEKEFLIEFVRAHLTYGNHVNCNSAINSFNWNLVRVTNRSADECKKQMELMLKNVCRYRTWIEVLNAYEQDESKSTSNKRTATTSRKRRTRSVVPEKEEGRDIEIQPVRRRKKADVTCGSVTHKGTATSSRKRRDKNVVSKKEEEGHEIAIPSGSGTIDVFDRDVEAEVLEQSPETPACDLTTNHEREPRKTHPVDVMSVNLAIPSGSGTIDEHDAEVEAEVTEQSPETPAWYSPTNRKRGPRTAHLVDVMSGKSAIPSGSGTNKSTATRKRRTKNVERESHEIKSEPSRRRMKTYVTCGESAIPSGSGTIDEHDAEVEDEAVEQCPEPRKTQQLCGQHRKETHGPYTIDVKNVVEFNGIREKLPLTKNEESANIHLFQFTTTIQVKTEETLSEEPDRNKLKRKQPNKCRTNVAKKKPSLIVSDSDE